AYSGLLVSAFMLPMLSNDVFSLFAYGSLAAHGQDVYATASALAHSVWYPWIGERWLGRVCVYGPTTLVGVMPAALAGGNPWLALVALRVAWLVPLVAVMEVAFRRLPPFFHAMVWLNPLWLLEGPGQLHPDLLGVVATTAGIVLHERGRVKSGWVAFGVAVLGKYSFAPAGAWFWLFRRRTLRQTLLRVPAIAAVLVVMGVVCFAPFWRGPATVAEPVRALVATNPGGSITDVAGLVVHVLRGRPPPRADVPAQIAMRRDRENYGATWAVVGFVLRIVTLGVAARVLTTMFRRPRDEDAIALGTGALAVAVITLASHRFQSWYLMAALPFFGLACTDAWRRWWIAVVALSVTPQFAYLLPRTALILPAWTAVSTAAVAVVFVVSFRARYLDVDPARVARGAPAAAAR
ncbi:MAG TPA: hypothetical protein VE987_15365, partial [Polyangiaceae bacterium]|nr:hypothetical protein [Polyangiaceae bacterium]